MAELLQDWLRRAYPKASQTTLRRMLQDGRVRVNGSVARQMKRAIEAGDDVQVASRTPTSEKPIAPLHPLALVLEDEHILVIDKPAGLLTSTVPRERRPTALAIVRAYVKAREPSARVGLIHRLDRDASGLLIFSKTDQAYRSLKQQFFEHSVRRVYAAITHGVPTPSSGMIDSRLVELPDGWVRTSHRPDGGARAFTNFDAIARERGLAALRVTLQTGRKHQIRAHLSERGVPIVGDRVYGKGDEANRLMLAAVQLGFVHPQSKKEILCEIAVPRAFPLVGGTKLSSMESK